MTSPIYKELYPEYATVLKTAHDFYFIAASAEIDRQHAERFHI